MARMSGGRAADSAPDTPVVAPSRPPADVTVTATSRIIVPHQHGTCPPAPRELPASTPGTSPASTPGTPPASATGTPPASTTGATAPAPGALAAPQTTRATSIQRPRLRD